MTTLVSDFANISYISVESPGENQHDVFILEIQPIRAKL